jgi:hypothetical protein
MRCTHCTTPQVRIVFRNGTCLNARKTIFLLFLLTHFAGCATDVCERFLETDACPSEWMRQGRLKCAGPHLQELNLSGLNLRGSITTLISAFGMLKKLVISNNHGLVGPLPSGLAAFFVVTLTLTRPVSPRIGHARKATRA